MNLSLLDLLRPRRARHRPTDPMTVSVELPPAGGSTHFGEEVWAGLTHFADMIVREGELRGLVGPRELERLWTRHLLNSTAVLDYIPEGASIADVGSGAGFPGLVVAIARPDSRVTLIDSMERRCAWLRDAAGELELANVSVRHGRSEEFRGRFLADVVTARAVANLNKLLPWTMPLIKPGGSLVALKGERVNQEIDDAVANLRKYNAQWADVHVVKAFGTDEETRVLEVRKKK